MKLLYAYTLIILLVLGCSCGDKEAKLSCDDKVGYSHSHEVTSDGYIIPKVDCINGVVYYYYQLKDKGYYTVALDSNTKVFRCNNKNTIVLHEKVKVVNNTNKSNNDNTDKSNNDFDRYIEFQNYLDMKKEMESEKYKSFRNAKEYFSPK